MTDCTLTPPSAPNADPAPRRGPLYVLAHAEPAYHIWDAPATPGSTGRSLCGIVTAWPDGGLYRTGRPKPRIADTTEGRRHLCARCREAYVDEQYAAQVDRLVNRLVRTARQLGDARLSYAAQHAPTAIARHVARQVLGERGARLPVADQDPATAALLAQQTVDLTALQARQTRALGTVIEALQLVPASPEIAALIEPAITIGRQALGTAGGAA